MNTYKLFFIASVLLVLASCKERFDPQIPSTGTGYLIVEGNLNGSAGGTTINLSRSYALNGNIGPQKENQATVSVEGSDGSTQFLPMTSPGTYTSPQLTLSSSNTYRLRIKTTDGKEYLSDAMTPLTTPPIDSIGWNRDADGIEFYVNSTGNNNNSRYYRWDYDETWEIRSFFFSIYTYQSQRVRERRIPEELVINCWKYGTSNTLLLGSSTALSSNVIHQKPLYRIPPGSEKLSVRYSVLLKQYSLTKEAFEFYDLMKKNTESLGTIFDVQPSELRGNIRCINDDNAIAIGYVTASSLTTKRIFVDRPQDWVYNEGCASFVVPFDSVAYYYSGGINIPVDLAYHEVLGIPIGYITGAAPCVDCTRRGGNLNKPSYW